MTKNEIVGTLARERRVEQIVQRIAGASTLSADLQDLSQMVYLTILEYDEDKIQDLWECGAINFLIVRLVANNLRSKTSRFYYLIKIFAARSSDLAAVEYKTENEG